MAVVSMIPYSITAEACRWSAAGKLSSAIKYIVTGNYAGVYRPS